MNAFTPPVSYLTSESLNPSLPRSDVGTKRTGGDPYRLGIDKGTAAGHTAPPGWFEEDEFDRDCKFDARDDRSARRTGGVTEWR